MLLIELFLLFLPTTTLDSNPSIGISSPICCCVTVEFRGSSNKFPLGVGWVIGFLTFCPWLCAEGGVYGTFGLGTLFLFSIRGGCWIPGGGYDSVAFLDFSPIRKQADSLFWMV